MAATFAILSLRAMSCTPREATLLRPAFSFVSVVATRCGGKKQNANTFLFAFLGDSALLVVAVDLLVS